MVKGLVPKPIENVPGPSRLIPDKTPPISPTESELDIERGLDFGPGEKDDDNGLEPPQEEEEEDPYRVNLTKLCQEGEVKLLSYFMAKAVSPTAEAPTHPKSWGYKDISRLPELECQECYKNSALFAQFLLSFLTYVLLSYFVHLHCANIHTPLHFF